MRRLISISLLLLFSLPLIAPPFASSPAEANLPLCCRRNGKHHCMMPAATEASMHRSSETQISVLREPCPYGAATVVQMATGRLAHTSHCAEFASLHAGLEGLLTEAEAQYRISFDRSRQKRGPPHTSLYPS